MLKLLLKPLLLTLSNLLRIFMRIFSTLFFRLFMKNNFQILDFLLLIKKSLTLLNVYKAQKKIISLRPSIFTIGQKSVGVSFK